MSEPSNTNMYEHSNELRGVGLSCSKLLLLLYPIKGTTTDYSIDAPYAFETNSMYQSIQRLMRFVFQSFADDRFHLSVSIIEPIIF